MKKSFILSIAAAGTMALAAPSFAATDTAVLGVSATVADTCVVAASLPLAFATFDSGSVIDEDSAGLVSVICSSNKVVQVSLGGGLNESSGQRQMIGTGNLVPYNVHSDASHSTAVAVDGDLFNGAVVAAVPTNLSVYGQIPAGDYVAGTYADTITVTLTYP